MIESRTVECAADAYSPRRAVLIWIFVGLAGWAIIGVLAAALFKTVTYLCSVV